MNDEDLHFLSEAGISVHRGQLGYDDGNQGAFLDSILLAIDRPPLTSYTLNEINEAYRACRTLGFQQGEGIAVIGVLDTSHSRPILAVMRIVGRIT